MYIKVDIQDIYTYTAGKAIDAAKPTVIFIHGVLNDHSVWVLQSWHLVSHGFNVLAIDLPGHGKSAGSCPRSVQEAASFVAALLNALKALYGIGKAALVGHSWGSLIAMHTASLAPERVTHLAMVATAYPMRVSPALLDTALNDPLEAINAIASYSHRAPNPLPSSPSAKTALHDNSIALMQRILTGGLERSPSENLLHLGLNACNDYAQGFEAFSDVEYSKLAILFIVGKADKMTPPKAVQGLIDAAPRAQVVTVDASHQLMSEAPDETSAALLTFLRSS